jgi:hypothetical protein
VFQLTKIEILTFFESIDCTLRFGKIRVPKFMIQSLKFPKENYILKNKPFPGYLNPNTLNPELRTQNPEPLNP